MILNGVMTLQEAARKWGLDSSALRHAIRRGRLKATRSEGVWLIALGDMRAVYGEPKGDEPQTD